MNKDPRITAYAVGELQGREREKFESELALSAAMQKETKEILDLSHQLGLGAKPETRFAPAERAALIAKCVGKHRVRKMVMLPVKIVSLAAAAILVLFCGVWGLLLLGSGGFPHSGPWASGAYYPGRGGDGLLSSERATASSAPAPTTEAPQDAAYAVRAMLDQGGDESPGEPAKLIALRSGEPQRLALPEASEALPVPMAVPPPPAAAPAMSSNSEVAHLRRAVATPPGEFNTEAYASVRENEFVRAEDNPLSTFSIDVDTASYSNVRRFLNNEARPPAGAIRTEELINYFRYDYPQPTGEDPFSVNLEVSRAPWNPGRELVRIGLKGRELPAEERAPANLVFLIDVSGSMDEPKKLPLLQRSLSALVENLSGEDRVAMVTYAGSSGLVLSPTPGAKKREILDAIESLRAGGSTHGSEGIRLAYETAREHFRKDGNNRVILCTDGDFNVGVTSESELQKLIEKERESGVFLSVLGFGTGNLKDSPMELLADRGNGNYAYIDSIGEGRKVLVEQMGSTLFAIAKDVKIQVEFNPARVAGYRLIGYENRLLAKEDFNDDTKDAGEIGAGHTVTALYEIIPAGQEVPGSPSVDPLKYQRPDQDAGAASNELLTVKLRYKAPDGDTSKLIEIPLAADDIPAFDAASEDFRFATAVAAFGMKLRGSPEAGQITWADIQDIARGSLGEDPGSYRAEFLTLVEKAKRLERE
jgi:Ca-activated chloride channel family protein